MCPEICPEICENFCPEIFFWLCSGLYYNINTNFESLLQIVIVINVLMYTAQPYLFTHLQPFDEVLAYRCFHNAFADVVRLVHLFSRK